MQSPRISEETMGDFYLDENGGIWVHVSYCRHPTATLRKIDGLTIGPGVMSEEVSGAVGAPVFDRFTHLVKEET